MPSSSDIVWSIIWMIGILLVGVTYSIYWIFTYDEKNPNPIPTIDSKPSEGLGSGETATVSRDATGVSISGERDDTEVQGVGISGEEEGS